MEKLQSELELPFVANNFPDVPKDKQYLLKYFTTLIERQFLSYYLTCKNYSNFVAHTGCKCSMRWMHKMCNRIKQLEKVRTVAKNDFDLDLLTIIEKGKYKFTS
jgi:hypothetical protein